MKTKWVLALLMAIVGLVLWVGLSTLHRLTPNAPTLAEVAAPIPPLVTIPGAESASPGPAEVIAAADAVGDGRGGTITVTDSAGRQTVREVPPDSGDVVGLQAGGTAAATRATLEARSIPDLAIKLADVTMHALAPTAAFLVRATLPPGQADTPDLRRGMLLAANPQPRAYCGAGYDLRRTWPVTDVLVPCELKPGDGRVAYLLRYEVTTATAAASAKP